MQLKIAINLDNDAFQDDNDTRDNQWKAEVARILREFSDRLESVGFYDGMKLRDINGNDVGTAEIDEF